MKKYLKGSLLSFLNLVIIFQIGCSERFREGATVKLAVNVGEIPVSLNLASAEPAYEAGSGKCALKNSTSCGDSDVTNSIAVPRPKFDFLKFNQLDESILAKGPTVVAGIWVTTPEGKQIPNVDNYTAFGFTQSFASKTVTSEGKTLTQLNTVGEPNAQRDIGALLSHNLEAVGVSLTGAYVPAQNQSRRIYAGIMTCSGLTGKADAIRSVPSGFQVMRLMNKSLPDALAQLDFQKNMIPNSLSYRFAYENNQAVVSVGEGVSGSTKDDTLGQRALVSAAVDLKKATEFSTLKPETSKLLADFQSGLKARNSCSNVAASLAPPDRDWFSGPYYSDRGMELGIPCRILNGVGPSFAEVVDAAKKDFQANHIEIASRLARSAIWIELAKAIPQEWKEQNDIRCFPNQGLYINTVLNSAVIPIAAQGGVISQSGNIDGKSVHPESNLASYGPSAQMYFDTKLAPSGDSYGDIQTLFGMFSIEMGNGAGAGMGKSFSSAYSVFTGDLSKVSVNVLLGQPLSVTASSIISKNIMIEFVNRALATLPNGQKNNCNQVSTSFCSSKDYFNLNRSCRGMGYPACTISN